MSTIRINGLPAGTITNTDVIAKDPTTVGVTNKITFDQAATFVNQNSSFDSLKDVNVTYSASNAGGLIAINSTKDGVKEYDVSVGIGPVDNVFSLTRGTSSLIVSSTSFLNQDVSTDAQVRFDELKLGLSGQEIDDISTDITMGGATPLDTVVSTQKAAKTYVDNRTFKGLKDVNANYANVGAFVVVNPTKDSMEETDTLLTKPSINQFKLQRGTSSILSTVPCILNQNVAIASDVEFAKVTLTEIAMDTVTIDEISIKTDLSGASNSELASSLAIKEYVDNHSHPSLDYWQLKEATLSPGNPTYDVLCETKFTVERDGVSNYAVYSAKNTNVSVAQEWEFGTAPGKDFIISNVTQSKIPFVIDSAVDTNAFVLSLGEKDYATTSCLGVGTPSPWDRLTVNGSIAQPGGFAHLIGTYWEGGSFKLHSAGVYGHSVISSGSTGDMTWLVSPDKVADSVCTEVMKLKQNGELVLQNNILFGSIASPGTLNYDSTSVTLGTYSSSTSTLYPALSMNITGAAVSRFRSYGGMYSGGPTTYNDLDADLYMIFYMGPNSGNFTINGFKNGRAGDVKYIVKLITANNVVITNNSGSGTQPILTKSGSNITLSNVGVVTLICYNNQWFTT